MILVLALTVAAFAVIDLRYVHRRPTAMPVTPEASAVVDELGAITAAIDTFVAGKVAPVQAALDAANATIASLKTDAADSTAAIKAAADGVLAKVTPPSGDAPPDDAPAVKLDPLTGQPIVAGQ